MASCVLFTSSREEGRLLRRALHDRAAYLTDQELDCQLFQNMEQAAERLRTHQTQMIAWDMSQDRSAAVLEQARAFCRDAFLLIVASESTSPLTFLKPDIAPSSLILRPLGPAEVDRVACEMLRSVCAGGGQGCFVIERRGEHQQVPWERIYYFESREKKLFARMRGEEIGFTGTLDSLAETLPDSFQRCHRSFIVNLEKIDRVRFSENVILLWDGLMVPLSRGYKQSIKERGSGRV